MFEMSFASLKIYSKMQMTFQTSPAADAEVHLLLY